MDFLCVMERRWKNGILPMLRIYLQSEAAKILKKGCRPGIQDVTKPLYNRVKDKDAVTKMQYVDLHLWLVHDILMKGDKMGMANSLEVRVPFLDRNVLELAESLPLNIKCRHRARKLLSGQRRNAVSETRRQRKRNLVFRSRFGFG